VKRANLVFLVWAVLLIVAVISLSSPWGTVNLDPSTGGKVLQVSGSQAFPVGSAFLGLQFALLFVSFFVSSQLLRIVTALIALASFWLAIVVFVSGLSNVTKALGSSIEEATGIAGNSGHADLIVSVDISSQNYVFAAVLAFIGVLLVQRSLSKRATKQGKRHQVPTKDSQDTDYTQLWDEQ
jgi:hypothetical protein